MTDAEAEARFGALADSLLPEAEGMPRASDAANLAAGLKVFLNVRSDLRADVMRGLRGVQPDRIDDTVATLPAVDADAWRALTLACAWVYYGSAEVEQRLHYRGPERRSHDADAVPAYVSSGMLAVVIDAGPRWRGVEEGKP